VNQVNELKKLFEGNKRFVEGKIILKNFKIQREEVLTEQKPFVTVLTCSDSRVVPEYIFDVGIGEMFSIENAGNVIDKSILGSIEYGIEHLHTPLLVILGHSKCGAVTATCNSNGEKEGNNIDYIIDKINPAVKEGDIEQSVIENLKIVEKEILEKSKITKELVESGKLKIVRLKYLLESGTVIEV